MNRRYIITMFEIALLTLFLIACGPVPVPSTPETTLSPTLTNTVTPRATNTSTSIVFLSPTNTSTLILSPNPTNTPLPPPLVDIFPQVDGGERFVYINNDGSLSDKFVLTEKCVRSGAYGLQLMYSMKGDGNGGWGVHWNNSPEKHFNASGFSAFTFWVKGTGSETFQIGVKDTSGNEVKVESDNLLIVSSDWLQVILPLSNLQGVNVSSIENVNIGFNKNHGTGSICIDDILFTP